MGSSINIRKINKKLNALFSGRVSARLEDGCVKVSGSLSSWEDVVAACSLAAVRYSKTHVVNDIVLEGVDIPSPRLPQLRDSALDGDSPDVLIIGGGISGASIARELSKWKLDILLIDKEPDFAMQASGRNDGEVHPGVDLSKGSLKQHYVLLGNEVYGKICEQLDVPFERCGQFVGFTQGWIKPFVHLYAWKRRVIDGAKETYVISQRELREKEPELSPEFKFSLYSPSAGCVCPYGLTIAYAENAAMNGVRISLNTAVTGMTVEGDRITAVETNRGTLHPRLVINAAGVFAEDIAAMANDRFFSIHPRRGTNSILDRKAAHIINGISSIKKLELKHSNTKGGGILHTVDDNVLVGPNAVETYEKENTATARESIEAVFKKQKLTSPSLSERDIITYFTGVRAPTFEEDFIIEKGRKTSNIIHCAGIQSPGLTTAPVVACDIEKTAVELLGGEGVVSRNADYNPIRTGVPVLREMSDEERSRLIKENPDYGIIVCRCEEISKGEIIDALNSPICVPTVDGIKKRIRPGMGRCQGGFCSPLVTKIIAEHQGIPLSQVRKSYDGAIISYGKTKQGGAEQ